MDIHRDIFGHYLKLSVFGASHAPSVGMRLEHFPRGFHIDSDALQAFLERRAPGRDSLSTQRREADAVQFTSGLSDGMTTGDVLEAVIANTDIRPLDYRDERTVPRPGHADYTQWVQTGRIATGGGSHSGRMTAPLCIAGGLCLQWLTRRGVTISGRLLAAGGNLSAPDSAIEDAARSGDSVGGVIEIHVQGLPPGLGGPLFEGLESEISSAIFSIPGVKGLEFGAGFALSAMHGSQANDSFIMEDGQVRTSGNAHGGLLGGITTGMPLIFRAAMKPTPSIFQEQRSVDLALKQETTITVKGRHDPCIARRAVPVMEAMTAFVLADAMMGDEAQRPRICLTLTGTTLSESLAMLNGSWPFAELCELRADYLEPSQHSAVADFPSQAGMPVILTVRRVQDGGLWSASEEERMVLMASALRNARTPFAYVDLEEDVRHPDVEAIARERGTRIIRSLHDFTGPVTDIVRRARQLRGNSEDIPKLAFAVRHCSDMERLFRETADFTAFPHIICAMGAMGQSSRILACRTHSMLTFTSPKNASGTLKALGHLTPEELVRTYRFRSLTAETELYAVTGWPLGHTLSPELNNTAFFDEAWPAVMVPLPSESAAEMLHCAETLGIRGIAITIPHKKDILPLMSSLSPEAAAIGAVNTAVRTADGGWHGANTDIAGFRKALLAFLGKEDLTGCRVAILGAGGAANAIAYVIAQLHGDACIFNRTLEKAAALGARYGFQSAPLNESSMTLLGDYSQLIIQTTSVGLSSKQDISNQSDPIPFYAFRGDEQLYDLIYSPAETPLMARARAAGCKAENGLSMLIEQAREQRRLYREFAQKP